MAAAMLMKLKANDGALQEEYARKAVIIGVQYLVRSGRIPTEPPQVPGTLTFGARLPHDRRRDRIIFDD